MKLKITPIVVTLVASMLVLFGGWYMYQHVAIQSPMEKAVKRVAHVTDAKVNMNDQHVQLQLQVQPQVNLRELVQHVEVASQDLLGTRKLDIQFTNASSQALDDWWSKAMFAVAQAMENKQYKEIPQALKQASAAMPTLHAEAEMDEHNVYISLTDGTASKYIILPRAGEKMGVWPHELS